MINNRKLLTFFTFFIILSTKHLNAGDFKNNITISDLNLNHSIVYIKGNGERKFAYFFDPFCTYCEKFNTEVLSKLDNVTVYNYLLPILSKKSLKVANIIWCNDREKNYEKYLNKDFFNLKDNDDCINPFNSNIELANNLKIKGTPSFIFEHGNILTGFVELKKFDQILETSTKNASHKRFLDNPPAYCGGQQMINH